MGLITRCRTAGDPGDITAMRDIESRIEGELARLEKMEKHSEVIRKNVDGIDDEIRKAKKALDLLLRKGQSMLRALNVELTDEAAETASPLTLPNGALEEAVLCPVSRGRGGLRLAPGAVGGEHVAAKVQRDVRPLLERAGLTDSHRDLPSPLRRRDETTRCRCRMLP